MTIVYIDYTQIVVNMSIMDTIIAYMKEQVGVVDLFIMDDDVSNGVNEIEKSIKTRTNHDYVNVGCDHSMDRMHRICVFYTNDFQKEMRARLKLMTTDGTVMGMNLMPEEIEGYKAREDVVWVSEDFIVFPEVRGKGEEMFVLYPYDYGELHDIAPGCRNAIGYSPTPSSDHYLKELAGVPESQYVFTTVIAFDVADSE